MAPQSTTRLSTTRRDAAQSGTPRRDTAQHGAAQQGAKQHGTDQHVRHSGNASGNHGAPLHDRVHPAPPYQLLRDVLAQGLKELGYSREDLSVEVFTSDKQHVLDLYCSKGKNCCYKLYWPSFGTAYGNPRFSELGKVLTKVALERSRMVLCSPDWGAHEGNEYWRTLLDRLTITSVQLPDEAIYVPLGRITPIGKPGWGSMLSVVDGSLSSIPWEDLDSTLVQTIQRESDGLTLGDLKDRLRLQDAIEAIPGKEEYAVTNNNAPNSPCHVSIPD